MIKLKNPHPQVIKTYPLAIPIKAIMLNLTLLGFQIVSGF
jgi:hypothetical protein